MIRSLRLRCAGHDKDGLLAELWERGTGGVTETELPGGGWVLDAFFPSWFDDASLRSFEPEWVEHADRDWAEWWKEQWEPLAVGARWFLVPDWRDDAAPDGRIRLVIHARRASGSGYQAATQLMLRAMEEFAVAPDRFFDWGTGSGILTSAAHHLGARRLVACDVDPEAAAEAKANLEAAGVEALVFAGSGRSARGWFDVVVANMNAAALIENRGEIARIVGPRGRLIVGGFKTRRAESVWKAFGPMGFVLSRELEQEGWLCLILSRQDAAGVVSPTQT